MKKFTNIRYNLNNENGLVEIGFSIKPNFFQKIIHFISHTKYDVLFLYEFYPESNQWIHKEKYCCNFYLKKVIKYLETEHQDFKDKVNELLQ